jgi:protein-L-isoaspartate O-methyltransferase
MTTTAVLTPDCTSVRPAREPRQVEDRGAQCRSLLAHIGLTVGARALEIGAGPSGALDVLSTTVGTTGRVVSFEVDADRARQVRAFVRERCLTNVDVAEGDTRLTTFAPASFDLVHAWLNASPTADELLAEMVRLTRPGGYVAVHEPEPGIGAGRLAELLRRAGLGEIGSETRPTLECAGAGRQPDAPRLIRLAWGRKPA